MRGELIHIYMFGTFSVNVTNLCLAFVTLYVMLFDEACFLMLVYLFIHSQFKNLKSTLESTAYLHEYVAILSLSLFFLPKIICEQLFEAVGTLELF